MPRLWRRSIGFVAMLCVLLHAGAIVRHVAMSVGSTLAQIELAQALGVICHGGGQTYTAPDGSTDLPAPSANGDCPVCAAAASTAALLAVPALVQLTWTSETIRRQAIAEIVAPRLSPVCPPSTGPPHIA